MAKNNLAVILGSMGVQGADRIRGGAPTIDLRAANVGLDPKFSAAAAKLNNMGNVLGSLSSAFMDWNNKRKADLDKYNQEAGVRNAKMLMQNFTPEELQKARADGVMPFQDDPYAMKAFHTIVGQNVALDIDGEISERIKKGEFKTREELDKARRDAFAMGHAKTLAEAYGAVFDDPDFQAGLNSQVVERNITLYNQHKEWDNAVKKNNVEIQNKTKAVGLYSDQRFLEQPDSPELVFTNISQQSRLAGDNPEAMNKRIRENIADIANRPGGLRWLQNAKNKKVNLNGQMVDPKAFFSEEQWQSLELGASGVQQKLDAKAFEDFNTSLADIQYDPDLSNAEAKLAGLKAKYNAENPTDMTTPERQQIVQLEQQLIARRRQENDKAQKGLIKAAQDQNKFLMFDEQYSKRLAGEYVPTDYKNIPTNEATGEIDYADAVNYANRKIAQVDALNLPDSVKDNMKMKLLLADSENGPFRAMYGTLVSDAKREWESAVANQQMPESTPAMDQLRRVRSQDSGAFAMLYPEEAAFFNKMDFMDRAGVKPEIALQAEAQQRTQSKEMRFQADKDWADSKNDSKFPIMARIPTELDSMAREVYDARLYRDGNRDAAREDAANFVKSMTTEFKSSDVDGGIQGVIPNKLLMVNSDPRSASEGKRLIDLQLKQMAQENPWITDKGLSVASQGKNIVITDITGQLRTVITQHDLQTRWTAERDAITKQQEEQAKKLMDEKIANANKRAAISQVPKVKEQVRQRKIDKARKVPKNIYGGQGEVFKDLLGSDDE